MNQHNHRQFAAALRQEPVNDDKLRDSLKTNGWEPHLPAMQDEHGNVLVGNRRLKLARELGIEPVIITIPFGEGEAAERAALKLAILSNEARAPFSKADRKRIALHLYGDKEWTMAKIAQALGVHTSTIGHDLEGFSQMRKPPARPQGGRPKGPGAGLPSRKQPVRRIDVEHEVLDQLAKEAKENGISPAAKIAEKLDPVIERSDLSMTAQQKLDAAIRQAKRKADADYEAAIRGLNEEVRQRVLDRTKERLAMLNEMEAKARETETFYTEMTNRHQPPFSVEQFKTILMCLHPDGERSKEKLAEAFRLFNARKLQLTGKK